jgi:hypothetical protein
MTKTEIIDQKLPFTLKYSTQAIYLYQENENKGEFIDHNGNVTAQLYEAEDEKDYFIIAGMFMGEVMFRTIWYKRCMNPEQGLRNILGFKK